MSAWVWDEVTRPALLAVLASRGAKQRLSALAGITPVGLSFVLHGVRFPLPETRRRLAEGLIQLARDGVILPPSPDLLELLADATVEPPDFLPPPRRLELKDAADQIQRALDSHSGNSSQGSGMQFWRQVWNVSHQAIPSPFEFGKWSADFWEEIERDPRSFLTVGFAAQDATGVIHRPVESLAWSRLLCDFMELLLQYPQKSDEESEWRLNASIRARLSEINALYLVGAIRAAIESCEALENRMHTDAALRDHSARWLASLRAEKLYALAKLRRFPLRRALELATAHRRAVDGAFDHGWMSERQAELEVGFVQPLGLARTYLQAGYTTDKRGWMAENALKAAHEFMKKSDAVDSIHRVMLLRTYGLHRWLVGDWNGGSEFFHLAVKEAAVVGAKDQLIKIAAQIAMARPRSAVKVESLVRTVEAAILGNAATRAQPDV